MKEIHYLLGNSCNLDCDFCFWDVRMPDVSLEFKKRIIDQIVATGIKRVIISGGEPLCANNFLEVFEYMHKHKLEIILHTNGLKIDDDMAQKLAPYISRVSLTLDGIDRDIILQMRKNKDITDNTIQAIKIFASLNIPVNVKTLVTKVNKNEIQNIGKIISKLPIKYWSLLEFAPINKGKINKNKFFLSSDDFDKIFAEVQTKFPSMEIKKRKYTTSKNKYCFIASNGDVYTYVNDKGDVRVGSIESTELSSIIAEIEK